jgi:hypothetical protein
MALLGLRIFEREREGVKHRDTEATERFLCALCVSVFLCLCVRFYAMKRAFTCRTNELYEPTR